MRKLYILIFLFTISSAAASLLGMSRSYAQQIDSMRVSPKIVDTRNNRPQNLEVSVAPFTPFLPYKKVGEQVKTISNVQVFPNVISDQINLSFKLGKDTKVSIKIMDALGNEITTLLSEHLTSGDQNLGYAVNGKLNSGYYFIRLMAGNETIIKRIQVL